MARRFRVTRDSVTVLFVIAALVVGLAGIGAAVQDLFLRSSLDREARALAARPFHRIPGQPVIVVTGSSTVRLWQDSAEAFPDAQVVNTGFGGSTVDALLDHYDGLIGRYAPEQVVIGCGDNDLAFGRTEAQIVADTSLLLDRIGSEMPGTRVAVVAAKPSVERWHLRDEYEALNAQLRILAARTPNVTFVDVWSRLVDRRGTVRPELYATDGLHLNARGYEIYSATLAAPSPVGAGSTRPSA